MRITLFRSFIIMLLLVVTLAVTFCINAMNELDYSDITERSKVLYDKDNGIAGYTLSSDTQSYRFYTTVDDVSPLYIKMLLASEDQRFYSHCGVDFLALIRAFSNNIYSQNITSGGSTIAMQVVKRLTKHDRTYYNKLKEVVQAIYITHKFGRDTVLNWYLTIAPFGSNIEGVKAASLKWFNHLPLKLTPSEAALLTALPRAPERIRPDKNYKATVYYKNEVLRLAYEKGVISHDVWKAALLEVLPNKLYKINQSAKNFADYLFAYNTQLESYSNIDPYVQDVLQREADKFAIKNKTGAVLSVVVLDARGHVLSGILGSSNLDISRLCLPFYKRSPGSTLKPFAYGLAFDKGKLHPNTLLHDNEKLYGVWKPVNFDRSFNGKIPASLALTLSLNLPALEVLDLIGVDNFINAINHKRKRIFVKDNTGDYSVILGSGGISLMDLTSLYGMLNEDGLLYDYVLTKNEPLKSPYRMLTKASARAVYNILKGTPRPMNRVSMHDVSYKTGTSSRFTDALAVGSMGNYTVGVAINYPNNIIKGGNVYSGYASAAPILFSILDELKIVPFTKEQLSSELLDLSKPPQALTEVIDRAKVTDSHPLRIEFPRDGETVVPDYLGQVFIKYTGGEGQIYLNVNDEQFTQNYFEPTHDGIYHVSLLDEKGRSAEVNFYVLLE